MWNHPGWSARNGRKTKDIDYLKISNDAYGNCVLTISGNSRCIAESLAAHAVRNKELQLILQDAMHMALEKVETDMELHRFMKSITEELYR